MKQQEHNPLAIIFAVFKFARFDYKRREKLSSFYSNK